MIDLLVGLLGLVLVALALWDVFETVIVPRPTSAAWRIGRYVILGSWSIVRRLRDGGRGGRRPYDHVLGLFGPAATVMLLVSWLATLIVGYGLIFWAIRGEISPVPPDVGTTIYFAGTSLLTLGYGEFVPVDGLSRFVSLTASVGGLGIVALVVTFLFSLYGNYQRREAKVVALQSSAGGPPSAVTLLETYARLDLKARLPDLFDDWQQWAVEVLDSHVAYPLLGFFRSSHDNLSWIGALGTMLDASCLVLSVIEDVPRGDAKLFKRVGTHLVEDVYNLGFRLETSKEVERSDFEAAYDRLAEAGYRLGGREDGWAGFQAGRRAYADRLEAMAAYWAFPASQWLGDPLELRQPLHPMED
jgi:hypothetical protein